MSHVVMYHKNHNLTSYLMDKHICAGSPCENDGVCVNTPGHYRCDCARGFTGPRCEVSVNECDSSPCLNKGTCLDQRGGYKCICMPGKSEKRLARGKRPLILLEGLFINDIHTDRRYPKFRHS